LLLLCAPNAANAASASSTDPDRCVDEGVKADLLAKRRQRSVKDRLFQKTNRHELTVFGGYYVSDLFDGTYVVGGAYTYHLTEDFGVEAAGAYTRIASLGSPELERAFSLLGARGRDVALFTSALVWSPIHAKMAAFGTSIVHFDLFFAAGAGMVSSDLTTGLAGNTGLGMKIFLGRASALRIDLRDQIYEQHLLPKTELVSDLSATLGWSVFLPWGE
jgi:outer membrane beta-barrel protein